MNYSIPPKKMLILNILEILKIHSDENHTLSVKDIGEYLEKEYLQKVDRKAIKRNLLNLIDFGYEIEYTESIRINKEGQEESIYSNWYLVRDFTDAELRLLIDSLLFSKTIPQKQCQALINKLGKLSNKYFVAKVKHICNLPEKIPNNKQVFYTIDILDEAISKERQVSFEYTEYKVDKKTYPRKTQDGKSIEEYIVSPYQMVATNGRYYLICNRTGYPRISHYRIDRINNIKLIDTKTIPFKELKECKNNLDLPKHMAEHIYMFAGDSVSVTFHAKTYLVGDILDWFGYDANITLLDEDNIKVIVKVNEHAMFYWSMQYGEHIEIIKPESLRMSVFETAKYIVSKYET